MKRIKSGKDKGKYLVNGLVVTKKSLKQRKSGYDIKIKAKSTDPTQYKKKP